MVEEVLQYMTQYHMVEPGDVVITGVSGGADSVCLLLVLQKLAAELSISIEAVHINHGIRTEAAGDAEFVRRLCEDRRIPFHLVCADVETQAKQEKQNTATSLRLQRQGLDRKLDMLIHDLSTGLIGREEFLYAKEKYRAELNRILTVEAAQKERIEQMQKGLSTAQAWVRAMQEYQRLPAITKELLDTLVERISIHEDRSITIQLNYADPFATLRPYHTLTKEAVCCG